MRILAVITVLISYFNAHAGNGVWENRINLDDVVIGYDYTVIDPTINQQTPPVLEHESYRGFIFLDYTRKDQSDLSQQYPWKIDVTVQYMNGGTPVEEILTVSSNADNIQTTELYQYSDYFELLSLSGISSYDVQILKIEGSYYNGSWINVPNPQTDPNFPDDIDIRLELRSERWYELVIGDVDPELVEFKFDPANFRLRWSYLEGAEEYDLEWVFIDALSQEATDINSVYANAYGYEEPFKKKEAVRVRLWQTNYTIDKLYPEGTIYFRLRAVSKHPDVASGMTDATKNGEWTYFELPSAYLGSGQYAQGTTVLHTFSAPDAHEPNKNWSYGIAFAEHGKSVSSVSYHDGTNRGRQSLTYNTSDDITLIGESKYDREGRQTLSVIPAPVSGRELGYRQDFNLAVGTNNIFDEDDYDLNDYTTAPTQLLTTNTGDLGAAQYFSPDNPFTDNLFYDAIPDANGFVYSQTIYRNDGSGRVERVGGIGEEFQVSGNRAIRTFYGSPTLAELKRLFGSNVPDELDGYRKEIVRDANGQYSVTYYDKRGFVIASGIAGEAPTNLLPLENQEVVEGVVTPLNDNNIQVGNNSMVSEHTFVPSYDNMQIKLNYSVNEVLQTINGQVVNVGGATFTFGDICVECKYILDIVVVDQNGQHYYPNGTSSDYTANIDSQGDCANPPVPPNQFATGTLTYTLGEVKEYRIIKTLTVDASSMITDYFDDLNQATWNNLIDFVDLSTLNIDYSDCYTDCDQYCEAYLKFTHDETHGVGDWDNNVPQATKDQLILDCMADYCNQDEFYEDFLDDSGQPISPLAVTCESYMDMMVDQITPGGVFYEDLSSWLWNESASFSLPDPVDVDGTNRSHTWLQDPANMTDAVAEGLILDGYHREFCHYQLCQQESDVSLYSMELAPIISNLTVPFNSPANEAILDNIYNQTTTSFSSDPFLSHPANAGNALQNAIADYLNHISYSNDFSNFDPLCSDPPPGQTTLFDYVVAHIACMQTLDPGSGIDYDELAFSTFTSLYNALVMELIVDYKELNCPYLTDEDAVFQMVEPETVDDIISGVLASVQGSNSCEDIALTSTINFVDGIEPACSTALVTNGLLVMANIDAATLALNSEAGNNPPPMPDNRTLEQLYYDFMMETCPENMFGWFFDPTGIDAGAVDEYNAIHDIMIDPLVQNDCGTSILTSIEVTPPTVTTTGTTVQTFPECVLEYVEMLNNGLSGLHGVLGGTVSGSSTCPGSYNITYGYVENVNSTNYPVLASTSCNLAGDYEFWMCEGNTGEFTLQLNARNGGCSTPMTVLLDDQGNDPNLGSYPVSFSNATKYASYDTPSQGTITNVIVLDILYANGASGKLFFNNEDCMVLGDFTDQEVYIWEYEIADEQQIIDDCINQTTAAAEIEAQILYNQLLGEMEEQLALSFQTCLDGTIENFQMEYVLKEYQYTLYYYDLVGNLVQTVPPEGVNPAPVSFDQNNIWTGGEPAHDMETRYKYNGLNTLLAQYTPDGGRSDFIHDDLYRVRFSQNARQSEDRAASYTKYDELGRIVEAGEFFDPVDLYDNPATTTIDEARVYLASNVNNNAFPVVGTDIVLDYTRTYYEEGYTPDPTIAQNEFSGGEQKNLRNAIGAVYHRELVYDYNAGTSVNGSVVETVISYSYDPHKNVQEMVTTNYLLEDIGHAHKLVEYDYDLISGNVNEVVYQRGAEDEYRHQYHYDANNRLVRAFTSRDEGITWDQDAKYFYYLHGPLARVEVGEDHVQGSDYAYNLQGWLKGVNSNTLISNWDLGRDGNSGDNTFFGVDAYGFSLGYYGDGIGTSLPASDYKPIGGTSVQAFALTAEATTENIGDHASLFNGNISNMVTAMRNKYEERIQPLMNNYKYDQLQRIRTMDVYHNKDLDADNDFLGAELYQGGAYRANYRFDANGNLLRLQRHGHDGNVMDNLRYAYYQEGESAQVANFTTVMQSTHNSNRLSYVSDDTDFTFGTTDEVDDIVPGQAATNYEYDESGQLIADNQEDIEEIIWTVTGKVKEIRFAQGSGNEKVRFLYDPMDMRIGKQVFTSCNYITTTYYTYDAQGNVMATYEHKQHPPTDGEPWEVQGQFVEYFTLQEHMIYGASRLGIDQRDMLLYQGDFEIPSTPMPTFDICDNTDFLVRLYQEDLEYDQSQRIAGYKNYEFSNHLGNVLVVATDRKVTYLDGVTTTYSADIVSYSDYYPYGMMLQGERLLAGAVSTGTQTAFAEEQVTFQSFVNTETDGNGDLILSTGTATSDYNNGASSVQTVLNGEYFEFEVESPTTAYNMYIGLSYNNTTPNFTDISYAFSLISGTNNLYFYGNNQYTFTMAAGDKLGILRDNGIIYFQKNGTTFYGGTDVNPSAPMYVDVSMFGGAGSQKAFNVVVGKMHTISTYASQDYTPAHDDSEGSYRYGFQGQEQDDEIKGKGNSVNYKYRMHDPRIGRFFAVDPLAPKYPQWTPYQFSGNQVIHMVELEGLEPDNPDLMKQENIGQTVPAQDRSTSGADLYNWTLEDGEDGLNWVRGDAITGPTPTDAANLADHVYNVNQKGVNRASKRGEVKSEYIDYNTGENIIWKLKYKKVGKMGYKSAMYVAEIDGLNVYAHASAGTDGLGDAVTDLQHALGLLDLQMFQSMKQADKAKRKVLRDDKAVNLTFVGHSLGGGLASANSLRTGFDGITFNAMGINMATKLTYNLNKPAKIDAYIVWLEAVDVGQALVGLHAEGETHYIYSWKNKIRSYQSYVDDAWNRGLANYWYATNGGYGIYFWGRMIDNHMMGGVKPALQQYLKNR